LIADDGIHSHDAKMAAPPSRRGSDEGVVVTEDAAEDMSGFGGVRETGRGTETLRRDDRLNQVGADVAFRHSQDEDAEAKVDSAASLVRCAHTDNEKPFEPDNAGMCSQSF